jgi:hypothetical protein
MVLVSRNPDAEFEDPNEDVGDNLPPPMGSATPPARTSTPSRTSSPTTTTRTMSTSKPTTKMTTGVVRLSYANLFKARAQEEGAEAKFSVTLLIPKDDKATLDKIAKCQDTAAKLKFAGKMPARLHSTLHDGDLPKESNGEPFGDECKGHWVLAVASKFKPEVIDREGNEIIGANEVASGDYAKVSLNFYGYDFKGKKGTSAGLGNVLFWERGESLGGTTHAADDFADDLNN